MLTSVKYITDNFNNQNWELGDTHEGLAFENYIHEILANELKTYYKDNLRITKTISTRDDGIDIYIESPIPFSLMGISFALKGKSSIKIVIECKSTKHNKISLDKFAKNIIENDELNLDYFVLVTNGTIVPSAFYKAQTKFEKNNCEFLLFDQYFLLQNLNSSAYEIPGKFNYIFIQDPLQMQYQLRKGRIDGRNCFELYLDMRNYSDNPVNIEFNLISNRNWNIEEKLNMKNLPPHKGKCIRFIVKRVYNDGIEDFKLNITYNNQSKIVSITNPEIVPDFQPPLAGRRHKKIINDIYNNLLNLSNAQFYYIYGEAGIGKTRIIDEITKKVFNTDYTILHIQCNKQRTQSLKDILYNKLKLKKTNNSSWGELLDFFEKHKFTRYLFIIEDLHNTMDDFYEELKSLIINLPDCPYACIIAGREDDTVYNEAFFSCSNWLKTHTVNSQIEQLDETETQHFITSIIKDIPSIVLEKLMNISNGNPFYIVQFIEYLLEIDFATLLNRNTVGMTNVNTFSCQRYIPEKIEKLIRMREESVKHLEGGQKYIDFLQMLCFFGISAPKEILEEYWGTENDNQLDFLFRKHYLAYGDNGDIKFDHETLFLFYNKELGEKKNLTRISKLLIEDYSDLLEYFPIYQKARVLFYAKKYRESEEIFQPILNEIENIPNISSTNLHREYFEYMNELYFLSNRKKKKMLQEKILQASVYIPMHNLDYGTTISSIKNALHQIDKNHTENLKLKNSILQLKAHTELTAAKLKQAEGLFLELLAEERLAPYEFSDESRFDLFDRTASLYTRYNHQALAKKYNKLSEIIADKLNDPKLKCLSIMMKAKINFYSQTECAIQYLEQANSILVNDHAYRINCHNNTSIVAANMIVSANTGYHFSSYIKSTQSLLNEAIDNNYSFTVIRCNLLLAALYYLDEDSFDIELSKHYINDGINASIRYGCEKLMNYFYNLKAIISIKEGYPPEETLKYFDTMLDFLIKQNLLFLGNLDFCYGNIISLSNYAKFIYKYGDEQRLYNFLNKISFYKSNKTCDFDCSKRKSCYYSCNKNIEIFKKNIQQIEKKQLIFVNSQYQYPLYDPYTGYYVIIH